MSFVRFASPWILLGNWILFSVLLALNHLRVRRIRAAQGVPEEKPSIRDPRSMHGLFLEGVSFVIALSFYRSPANAGDLRHVLSILFGEAAVILLFAALRHLDMEWRIKAVVTEDHRLVTTGPYAVLRHPIFAALFCLLLSTVTLATHPVAAIAAVAVCIYGTEIRIRAEDGLLEQRFGKTFVEYRSRVRAWLPGVR